MTPSTLHEDAKLETHGDVSMSKFRNTSYKREIIRIGWNQNESIKN